MSAANVPSGRRGRGESALLRAQAARHADHRRRGASERGRPRPCTREGEDWIEALENSPAWRLIGYGAVVGFRDRQPYGVLVRNSLPRSNYLAHLLICEPAAHRLHELFLRAGDRRWLRRTYRPVHEGDVDDAGKFGAEGLLQAGADRTSFEEITSFDSVAGELLQAIEGEAARR
jgi:hypothetical protein